MLQIPLIIRPGDRIRVYHEDFSGCVHYDTYHEGVVLDRDAGYKNSQSYRVDKTVLSGLSVPHSWHNGSVRDINIGMYYVVELLVSSN